jgi:AraC-like DNA-binding protein
MTGAAAQLLPVIALTPDHARPLAFADLLRQFAAANQIAWPAMEGVHNRRLQQRDYLLLERVCSFRGLLGNHPEQLLLLACLVGELLTQSDTGVVQALHAGYVLVINPGQTLDCEVLKPCSLLLVRMPLEELQNVALDLGLHCGPQGLRFEYATRGGDQVASLLHLLLDALRINNDQLWNQALPWYQKMCDTLILQGWRHNLGRPFSTRPLTSPLLQKARLWLQRHIKDDIDVKRLAYECSVSQRTLYNLFRRETSMTPREFVRALKIEQIHAELSRSNTRSVTGVVVEYGFTNLGCFARQYRQQIGELPSDTLRRHQGWAAAMNIANQ